MKRFTFPLEKLLAYRSFLERKAELALAEKAGKCTVIELALEKNAAETVRARASRFEAGRGIDDFRAVEYYLRRLDTQKERFLRELAAAEIEREEARVAYVEANKAKKTIEKLKERRHAEWKLDGIKEEIMTIDDIAKAESMSEGIFA